METVMVQVSNRGYIVLPAHLRKSMELKPGAKMLLSREGDRLILTPVHSFADKLAGLTKQTIGKTPQDVADFIDQQREDRGR